MAQGQGQGQGHGLGQGQGQGQRERFDAEGNPVALEANAAQGLNGDNAIGQDVPREPREPREAREPRQDRSPRNGERGDQGDRPDRSRGGERGRGSERGLERGADRGSERVAERNTARADGQGEGGADAVNGFTDKATLPRDAALAPQGLDESNSVTPAGTDAEGNPGREKRSRDRYGRDRDRGPRGERADRSERPERGERSERQERAPNDSQQPLEGFAADARAPNAAPNPVDREPRTSYFSVVASPVMATPVIATRAADAVSSVASAATLLPQATATRAEDTAPASLPVPMSASIGVPPVTQAVISSVMSAPPEAPAPTAASAPARTAMQNLPLQSAAAASGLPKVQAFELPVDSLQQVAQTAGLAWVNSNPEKAASVKAAIAAEPKPIHVPRERPASTQPDTSPLVLVETKRDLRNMTLPFEQTTPQ